MNQQEKWVKLFEQVIGRKPSPQEFMAGKASNFDFKAIKPIAGLGDESNTGSESVVEEPATIQTTPEPVEEVVAQVLPMEQGQPTQAQVTKVKVPLTKKQKVKRGMIGAGLLAILGLGAGYYYMDSVTGLDVAAEAFNSAVDSNDFERVAELLSTKQEKWKAQEAKDFLTYLKEADIDVPAEINALVKSQGKNTYHDSNGNKLLGMKEVSRRFWFFPEYQVTTYPLEVKVQTNMDDLSVDGTKINKGEPISLGQTKFVPTSYQVTGKTDLGDLNTKVVTNLNKAEDNVAIISLATNTYSINASLPSDLSDVTDVKLIANGKEVANGLSKDLNLMDNQELEVYATFNYEGTTYTTEKVEQTVSPDAQDLDIDLELSPAIQQQIDDAKKAKAEKAAEEQKTKETESNIKTFMSSYIDSMRSSVSSRTVYFSSYFDTNSSVYKTYVNFVEKQVAELKVDYQDTLDYTVTGIKKEGNDYVVSVHNKYKEYYTDSTKPDDVEKNQVFKLRPNGDSFLIYEVSEY